MLRAMALTMSGETQGKKRAKGGLPTHQRGAEHLCEWWREEPVEYEWERVLELV